MRQDNQLKALRELACDPDASAELRWTYVEALRAEDPRQHRDEIGRGLMELVAAKHALAAYRVSVHYAVGTFSQANTETASAWSVLAFAMADSDGTTGELQALVQREADAGCPEAVCTIGRMHIDGSFGYAEDHELAVQLLSQVANHSPRAMALLGKCAEHGCGMPADLGKAAECYQRAASRGEPRAAARLAGWLVFGEAGQAVDHPRARRLFRLAEALGCEEGTRGLAVMHALGMDRENAAN